MFNTERFMQEEIPYCSALTLRPIVSEKQPVKLLSFIALGDIPYYESERYCLNEQLRALELSPPDQEGPSIIVHVGDIKKGIGGTECDEEAYNDIAEIFTHKNNTLGYDPRDVFFVVGDNEWVDCESPNDAWTKWMRHFGPNNPYGFGSLSSEGINVERQLDRERLPGVHRGENMAFLMNDVLFIGLNLIGGPAIGDEDVRLKQNYDWVKEKLEYYSQPEQDWNLRAMVVFAHAPMDGARRKYFGAPFQRLLAKQYQWLPVMFLHGNGHVFCAKYLTAFGTTNLVDVEVEAGDFAPPIEISILEDPEYRNVTFHIDQRGGLYRKAGNCPQIRERTWYTPDIPPGGLPGGGLPSAPIPTLPPLSEADLVPLAFFKNRTAHLPFQVCQGHCEKNSHCETGLKCFRRKDYEKVPGCWGEGIKKRNYCYNPIFENVPVVKKSTTPVPTAPPTSQPTPAPTPEPSTPPTSSPTPQPTLMPTIQPTSTPTTQPTASPTHVSTILATGVPTPLDTTQGNDAPITEEDLPELTFFRNRNAHLPFKACQGHCGNNRHCDAGLICKRRKMYEPVPGCSGQGRKTRNYCYDPNAGSPEPKIEASPPMPKTSPTPQPTTPPMAAPTIASTLGVTVPGTPPDTPPPTAQPTIPQSPDPSLTEPDLVFFKDAAPDKVYSACQGHCSKNSQCESGLKCFRRKEFEKVPGCAGQGTKKRNYCYDPSTKVAEATSPVT